MPVVIRAALAACLIAAPAAAELPCLPRADLVAQLLSDYGESLTARFLTTNGTALVEVYTAAGSWTILITDAAGKSCMIAASGAWTMQGVPQGEPG